MADYLLIHIDSQFDVTQVISYDKAQNIARRLNAEQFKSSLTGKNEVILLLPASWVYLTTTQVASRSADILQKSIPYSVEDELVNDIDDNYYAWKIQSEQQQSVAVIDKNKRHQINDFIKKQQLQLSALYSEAVFCPAKQQQLTLWQDNKRVLLRFGVDTAMVTSVELAPQLISTFGQDCQHLLTNNPDGIELSQFKTVTELDLTDCCAHIVADNEVNLYRGEDHDREQQQQSINWLKPLLAAGFLLLSWVFVTAYQGWQLSSDISTLKQQQQNILKQKFGTLSATEQRDPFAAMQSRLQQINQQQRPNNVLLDGLHFLGETRRQQQNIDIKGLRLFDNNLEIQVTAPAISDINSFREQLQNLAINYRVNIGVNELTDGVYQSILTMKPR